MAEQAKPRESLEEEKGEEELNKQKATTDNLGFLGFAVVSYILYTSIVSSAQDILASTNIPTTTIIMCFNGPYFVMTLILPYYIDKMGLMSKALISAAFFGLGLLLVALISTPAYRLIGVTIASVGMGMAEIGFLSGTSLHKDLTLHSFTCGTGLGAIIGTAYSAGVTSILCVKPTTAMLVLLVLLPIFPILTWFITRPSTPTAAAKSPRGSPIEYTRLDDNSSHIDLSPITWKEKFLSVRDNLGLAASLFVGLFADYLTMQAVVTTIVFKNSPFDARDHFIYYQLTFWVSEIIGRSYGLVILWFKPTCQVVTDKTWLLSAIIAGNMIVLICESWYRFLPSFGIVAILVAITGATEGALYLNTFAVAGRKKEDRPRSKEFSRAFLTIALQGGVVTAAIVGSFVEPMLTQHCKEILMTDSLCFTRLSHGQWNATSSCLLH